MHEPHVICPSAICGSRAGSSDIRSRHKRQFCPRASAGPESRQVLHSHQGHDSDRRGRGACCLFWLLSPRPQLSLDVPTVNTCSHFTHRLDSLLGAAKASLCSWVCSWSPGLQRGVKSHQRPGPAQCRQQGRWNCPPRQGMRGDRPHSPRGPLSVQTLRTQTLSC